MTWGTFRLGQAGSDLIGLRRCGSDLARADGSEADPQGDGASLRRRTGRGVVEDVWERTDLNDVDLEAKLLQGLRGLVHRHPIHAGHADLLRPVRDVDGDHL